MNNPDSRPFSVSFSGWFLKPALLGLLLLLNTGCAGLYFRPAQQLPLEIPRYTLDRWLYAEYWTGIVYSETHQGFLYHTWAESYIDGNWIPVDPVFGQLPADATHIKLITGENPSDLVPLTDMVGNLQVEILSAE